MPDNDTPLDESALLEKNPTVREIFEQNRAKMEKAGLGGPRKPTESILARPYGRPVKFRPRYP